MDVADECLADKRELLRDGVQHRVPQGRGTGRYRHQDRHQDHQQREHRDERGVSQIRGEGATIVVAVLLDHTEGERGDPAPLLCGVHPADHPLYRVHADSAARQGGSQTPRRHV